MLPDWKNLSALAVLLSIESFAGQRTHDQDVIGVPLSVVFKTSAAYIASVQVLGAWS